MNDNCHAAQGTCGSQKTIHILAIGNSFSEDATHYLHQIARASGIPTKVVNLYIGGCPLEKHWRNIETGEKAYQYQLNGVLTDTYVSIADALSEEKWDIIVTQQASHDSGWQDTYAPFAELIRDHLRREAPQARLYMQQTWAYETDSPHDNFMRYHRDQQEMYARLSAAYEAAAAKYGFLLIPCGDVIQKVRSLAPFRYQEGGLSLCRDGFHMSFLYGRFLLAGVWASCLLGVHMTENVYQPSTVRAPGETAEEALLQIIRSAIDDYMETYDGIHIGSFTASAIQTQERKDSI